MEENKNAINETEELQDTLHVEIQENVTDEESSSLENPEEQIIMATDENGNYYPSTYVVYGLAIGVAAGAILMNLTDSRFLLSLCTLIGTIIGYCIKKKNPEGDSHEK